MSHIWFVYRCKCLRDLASFHPQVPSGARKWYLQETTQNVVQGRVQGEQLVDDKHDLLKNRTGTCRRKEHYRKSGATELGDSLKVVGGAWLVEPFWGLEQDWNGLCVGRHSSDLLKNFPANVGRWQLI